MLTSNQLTAGLNTDIHPKFQEEGTYRFALNAVLETREGDYGTLSNEIGNSICAELPYGTRIIGHANTPTEEIVLFLFHRSVFEPAHEIGIYNPITCKYRTIARSPEFNFSDKHPINAFVRVRNGCEWIVYFTDNYNPYRVANLTDTSDWITPNTTDPNINKIKFTRSFQHVNITLAANNDSGGTLELGLYNFVIRYLDAENNATNWQQITRPVAISDDSVSLLADATTYWQYDGGSNLPNDIGYVPRTSKSIDLTLSNIDQNFKYYQIAVIKKTSTDGSVSGVDVLIPQPITDTDGVFKYTGYSSQIQYQTSLDEILSENLSVYTVKSHATLDNRLYIANTQHEIKDYTGFQRHASSIKVEYVKERSHTPAKRPKQPNYYFNDASFMDDEIYALGIVYVFNDGTISPAFPIPGRAPDTNIVGTNPHISGVTNWDTDDITGNANIFNNTKTKRWQSFNTATKYNTPYSGSNVSGLLGYYEGSATYPEMNNPCDTHPDGYWGRDWQGNLIEAGVTKIRHHRMPAAELQENTPIAENYKTGLRFTVSQDYPNPNIVGHFFVYSDRTEEKTILDKGLLVPIKYDSEDADNLSLYAGWLTSKSGSDHVLKGISAGVSTSRVVYGYISPKTTMYDTYEVGSYLRIDRYLFGAATEVPWLSPTSERYDKVLNVEDSVVAFSATYTTFTHANYKIDWSAFLRKSSIGSLANSVNVPAEAKSVQNVSIHNNYQLIVTNTKLAPFLSGPFNGWSKDRFVQVSIKADTEVFNNLFQINYRRIGNTIISKTNGVNSIHTSYAGDTFITSFNPVDYMFARNGAGDVFVSGDTVLISVPSDINYEFRHGDDTSSGQYTYYKINPNDPKPLIPFVEYIADKYYEPVKDESSYFYPETYLLNKSFNSMDSINRYLPIPFDYEFCNDCIEKFPYRIYYSEQDNGEESKDYYRIIRPNNYQDLPGITGEINDLFNNFSKLVAITDQSPYYIPTRPQQLITEGENVYLGTAEVFGISPTQLKVTDYHFGGSRLFKSRITTEYGTFYMDDYNGRPFMIDDQLNDLSLKGMRNFWLENGRLFLDEEFRKSTGQHYPILSPVSNNGIGYMTTYDPRFKRIIVHKKDYETINNRKIYYSVNNPGANKLWFNGTWFYDVDKDGIAKLINLNDPKYFVNKSFTLSYSFLTKSWVSFHSYLPYYLFNNYLSYYSVHFDDQYIYKHLVGDHTNYYGLYYDHIVDLIAINNPNEEAQYTNVIYASSTQEYDNNTKSYRNIPTTFNSGIFYNSKQSTGLKTIQLKTDEFQFDYNNTTILVDKTDNKFRLSNLRDNTINEDEPIWDSSWNALQSSPFVFIDKLPNTNNIDFTDKFIEPRLKDYYLGIRLINTPTQDIKINTDIINTRNVNRNR